MANAKTRGIFERPKRSGIWWVRYADQFGQLHREKCGAKSLAHAVYNMRKTAIKQAKFFPEQVGQHTVILFDELAKDFLAYSKLHKRSHAHDVQRMQRLLDAFGGRPAKVIDPQESHTPESPRVIHHRG